MFLHLFHSLISLLSSNLLTPPFLFPTCSCRVHGYSFWIGLLIPFGIIYIINWILYILIFVSLLCKPDGREETRKNAKLHKLKENFTITLGLSLLFGIGWAVGLLASSDLPHGVRYPAEWIFTLMTAFLGVYLFVLYIPRSSEARGLWKRWLLCQRKKKRFVSLPSTTSSRTRLGNLSSTVRSWWKSLKANTLRRPSQETNGSTLSSNRTTTTTNPHSSSSAIAKITDMTSPYAGPSSVLESSTARVTSPYFPPMEIDLVQKMNMGRKSNNEEANPKLVSSLEVPVKLDAETESFIEAVMSSHDNMSVRSFNSLSSIKDPSPSGAHGECYTVESKQAEGADTK